MPYSIIYPLTIHVKILVPVGGTFLDTTNAVRPLYTIWRYFKLTLIFRKSVNPVTKSPSLSSGS